MLNMMKSDLYRMTKSKSFYLYWALILFTFGLTIALKEAGGIQVGIEIDKTQKLDLQMVAMNYTFYYLFLFPVYGIVVCDFGERTIKNTISSAISRRTYLLSKLLLTEIYTITTFVVSNVLFYGINSLINGEGYTSEFEEFMGALLRQCPVLAAVVALLVALGFLLKKMATFNAISILVPMIYSTVAVSIYQAGAKKFATEYMLKYELATMLSRIASGGAGKYFGNCILFSIVLLVISIAMSYTSFMKTEIK